MTQHTQEPWYYEGLEMTIENYMGKPVPYAIKNSKENAHPNKNVVAVVDTGAFSQNENLANARLIAAAPELLAALKELLAIHDDAANGVTRPNKHEDIEDWYKRVEKMAREAIAKATGE